MQNPSIRRQSGFTLVELLVVITIIAVLAGAGFAAASAAIQKAKKVTALATATALESAVSNFYTEYGSMPKNISADTQIDTSSDTAFLNVLLGSETVSPILNTRAVKFLSVKEGKRKGTGGINGLVYDSAGTTVNGLFDPWGGPFYVLLDGNYDEKLAAKTAKDPAASNLNGRRAVVWSNGADGIDVTEGTMADDVKTWGK